MRSHRQSSRRAGIVAITIALILSPIVAPLGPAPLGAGVAASNDDEGLKSDLTGSSAVDTLVSGSGTENDPYRIEDWYDFDAVRENLSAHYRLVTTLNKTTSGYDEVAGPSANGGNGFDPIGNDTKPFTGEFEGSANRISDVNLNRSGESYVGLFGAVENARVANVSVKNVTVQAEFAVSGLAGASRASQFENIFVSGLIVGEGSFIGGMVGEVASGGTEIHNATTAVEVRALADSYSAGGLVGILNGESDDVSEITNSTATGDVFAGPDIQAVGGLVGVVQDGVIRNSRATGSISVGSGLYAYTGGLVGYLDGVVTNSSATGDVYWVQASDDTADNLGGLVGYFTNGKISRSFASGNVRGYDAVGGLVGTAGDGDTFSGIAAINQSYATGDVEAQDVYAGGLIGFSDARVRSAYARGSVTGDSAVGGLIGYNDPETIENTTAVTKSYAAGNVSGDTEFVGGLVGSGPTDEVAESYWDINTSGQNGSDGGTGLRTAAMSGEAARENMSQFDFQKTWNATRSYPVLQWQNQGRPLGETIVVDATGEEGQYEAIQPAVENASDRAHIEVRPGTYRETVYVNKNVTIVAPEGAILDQTGVNSPVAFVVQKGSHAAPRIDGFRIEGFNVGLFARETTGPWELRNATLVNQELSGVYAQETSGEWVIANSVIKNSSSTFAVDASRSDGDWLITKTTVTESDRGINAFNASGNWSIERALIRNNSNTAVIAENTSGDWSITQSNINNNTGFPASGVEAQDAEIEGDATRNWWGRSSGATDGQCAGNVDCSNPLSSPADAGGNGSPASIRSTSEIVDWTDLNAIRDDLDGNYVLANDLNKTTPGYERVAGPNANNGTGFQPIGNSSIPFNGTFDGNGYEITNLTVGAETPAGLFGVVGEGGIVENVVLNDVVVTSSGSVIGGAVGRNRGSIINTIVTDVEISADAKVGALVGVNLQGAITDSAGTKIDIASSDGNSGGLVGINRRGTITNATASGNFSGTSVFANGVGGLVGRNLGGDLDDVSTEVVVDGNRFGTNTGGLVGENTGNITGATANGAVTEGGSQTGGLAGSNSQAGNITRSSAEGPVGTSRGVVGGFVGQNNGVITQSHASGNVTVIGRTGPGSNSVTARAGGFAGENYGRIDTAYALGNVTSKPADSDAAGEQIAGGIAARNFGTVKQVYATGPVTGATGDGGLAASADTSDFGSPALLSNAYWDINTTGQSVAFGTRSDEVTLNGDIEGLRTEQMTGSAASTNMTGLDFEQSWRVTDSYPRLVGQDLASVSFITSPERLVVNSSIEFNATVSPANTSIVGYQWQFGDGGTAAGPVVTHSYNQTGTFDVALKVTFRDGSEATLTEEFDVLPGEILTVDASGETGNYTAIQPAVDNASDRARIEVLPGTYNESVTVDKNVTLIAPDGATIGFTQTDGYGFTAFVIPGNSQAAPTIDGFTVPDIDLGTALRANGTHGDWRIVNLTATGVGIAAQEATGAWTVDKSVISDPNRDSAIRATETTGDWRITHTRFRKVIAAINATSSSGDWTVTNASASASPGTISPAVEAVETSGNWVLENITIEDIGTGVTADRSSGDWRITGLSTIRNTDQAISAVATTGNWQVHRTNFVGNQAGIDAREAAQAGNARRNWWGSPWSVGANQCQGNVTCTNPLGEPASSDATGVEIAVSDSIEISDPANVTAQPGAHVYLYDSPDSPVDPNGPSIRTQISALDGRELVFDDGLLLRAKLNVTTGPDGLVRYTGLENSDYCLLVDPPRSSSGNVSAACLTISNDTVADRRVNLTNETYFEYIDQPAETIESGSRTEVQDRIFAAKSIFPDTGRALDSDELLVKENAGYYKDISASIQCAAGGDLPTPSVDSGRIAECNSPPSDTDDLKQLIVDEALTLLAETQQPEHYAEWAIASARDDNNGRVARYAANLSDVRWVRQPVASDIDDVDYQSLATVRNARTGIDAAHDELERVQRGNLSDTNRTQLPANLNQRHVKKVFEQQQTAFEGDGIAPGLVITPTGEVVLFQRAEAHIEVNENAVQAVENADRAKEWAVYYQEVGDTLASIPHPVAQTAGGIIWGVARAGETAADAARFSAQQRVADSFAKTQIYTLYDIESIERVNRNNVEWLEEQYKDPITGRIDGKITEEPEFPSDDNGINVVTATEPDVDTTLLRTRAKGTVTVAAKNTGNATAETRLVGVGRYQANYGIDPNDIDEDAPLEPHVQPSVAPAASDPPAELAPGETIRKDLNYVFDNPKTEPYRFHTFVSVLVMNGRQVDTATDWTFVNITDVRGNPSTVDEGEFCSFCGPDGVRGYEFEDIQNLDTAVPDTVSKIAGVLTGAPGRTSDQRRLHTGAYLYTTEGTPDGAAITQQTFESNRQNVGTLIDTEVAPGSKATQELPVGDDTASTTVMLIAPPSSGASLQVEDSAGNIVGYRPDIEAGITERSTARYTGSENAIERVVLGDAAGENLTVTATAAAADETVPVEVIVIETPDRPAMMGVLPGTLRATVDPGETANPAFGISEIGGQEPIQNVTISQTGLDNGAGTQLPADALTIKPATVDRINATETRPLNATVQGPSTVDVASDEPTEFTGELTVETSTAGSATIPVSVLLLDSPIEEASLIEADRAVTGVHFQRAAAPELPDEVAGEPIRAFEATVQASNTEADTVKISLADASFLTETDAPLRAYRNTGDGWEEIDAFGGETRLTLTIPSGDQTVVVTALPNNTDDDGALPTEPDNPSSGGNDAEPAPPSDGDPVAPALANLVNRQETFFRDDAPAQPGHHIEFDEPLLVEVVVPERVADDALRTNTVEVAESRDVASDVPEPNGEVLGAVDITMPAPVEDDRATLEFVVPADRVDEPDAVVVHHYNATAETWTPLPTDPVDTSSADVVRVDATTSGFSAFAVTEVTSTDEQQQDQLDNADDPDSASNSDSDSKETAQREQQAANAAEQSQQDDGATGTVTTTDSPEPSGFGVVVVGVLMAVVIALTAGVFLLRRRQ